MLGRRLLFTQFTLIVAAGLSILLCWRFLQPVRNNQEGLKLKTGRSRRRPVTRHRNTTIIRSTASQGNDTSCPPRLVFGKHFNASEISDITPESALPKHLHLAFLGDSVSRYMYVSLINYLHTGQWSTVGNRSDGDWAEYYNTADEYFSGFEVCDCFRHPAHQKQRRYPKSFENRYYRDLCRDNIVSFIVNWGIYQPKGHILPNQTMPGSFPRDLQGSMGLPVWKFSNVADTITHYVSKMVPKPDVLVLNQGIWGNSSLEEPGAAEQVHKALKDAGIVGIYRTTTIPLVNKHFYLTLPHDAAFCQTFEYCIDASWTKNLTKADFDDNFHPSAPTHKRLNLELFNILDTISAKKGRRLKHITEPR